MSSTLKILQVESEQATISLLKGLLDKTINADEIDIDFNSAKWIGFHLRLDGPNYHSSLNADLMRALVEYQYTLYRIAAYFSDGKLNAAAIDSESRERLRLNFEIRSGCSEIDSGLLKAVGELANRVTKGMGPRQRFITILTAMLLLSGAYVMPSWIDKHYQALEAEAKSDSYKEGHKEDMAVVDSAVKGQAEIIGKIIENQAHIIEAIKQVPKLAEVQKQAGNAADAIVRQSADADKINFQGVVLSGQAVRILIGKKRRAGEDVVLTALFKVKQLTLGNQKTINVL